MRELSDLRRRAAQQASCGNYWAGKALALVDAVSQLHNALQVADEALSHTESPAAVSARAVIRHALKSTGGER